MNTHFYQAMKAGPKPEGCGELFYEEEFGMTLDEYSIEVRCCGHDGYLCPECEPEDEDAAFWREMIRSEELNRPEFPEFD